MAITKILHMKQAKSGYMAKHLANGLKYIMDPDKTEGGRYVSSSNCIPENALAQMLETKRHFGKLDKRQGYGRDITLLFLLKRRISRKKRPLRL